MYPTQICAYVFYAHYFEFMRILAFPSSDFFMRYSKMRIKIGGWNLFLEQLVTALKYEYKMFQKFITCLSDNSYISYMGLCICFIFWKELLDPMFFVIAMQISDFKNSIIAIQLFPFYDF